MPTRILLTCIASLPLVSAAIAAETPGAKGGVKLSASLSGANEVNASGTRNQGDPDGSGSFSGRLNPGQGQLCYTLTYTGIDAPSMAHIHTGAAGANGPVFVGLTDLSAGEHCIPVDREKATALVARSADYYVNIHNAAFPAGALRGQLVKN